MCVSAHTCKSQSVRYDVWTLGLSHEAEWVCLQQWYDAGMQYTICDNITLLFHFVPVSFIQKVRILCAKGSFSLFV